MAKHSSSDLADQSRVAGRSFVSEHRAGAIVGAQLVPCGRRQTGVICLLLLVLAVAVFLPCIGNGFVSFDDDIYVYANAHVKNGLTWDSVGWAFSNLSGGFWHPVTWLSHELDCQLFGLRPAGHHVTSLLLHAANTVLLFLVFRRMTGAIWRSAFVAALFAVHPLHVESVAWIAERKDVLSTFFWLLSLWAYVRYAEETGDGRQARAEVGSGKCEVRDPDQESATEHRSPVTDHQSALAHHAPRWYVLALLFFGLALLSKAMVVTLPLVLLLLDWWPLRRLELGTRRSNFNTPFSLLWEKVPFLIAAGLFAAVTFYSQRALGAVPDIARLPILYRVGNGLPAYVGYLTQMLWPGALAAYYPYPKTLSVWASLSAGLLLLAISLLALRAARSRPYLAFGWLWYLITLLPVVGFVQAGGQAHADRYTYVALIGIFALLAWGALELTRRWRHQTLTLSACAALVVCGCVVLTCRQISYWKDTETLFRHALAVTQDNQRAHNILGSALVAKGQVDEAIGQLREAIGLEPRYTDALNNLGAALLRKGQVDEAIGCLQTALNLNPNLAEAHCNLGAALDQEARLDEAAVQFQQALKLAPTDADAHRRLGIVLGKQGRLTDAIGQFEEGLKLAPADVEAHCNLGVTLAKQGQLEPAISQFQEALKLNPAYAEAHSNLGAALSKKMRLDEAATHLREALRLNPSSAEAHSSLGVVLGKQGRLDDAIGHLQEALRLKPNYPDARNNLRTALAAKAAATTPSAGPIHP